VRAGEDFVRGTNDPACQTLVQQAQVGVCLRAFPFDQCECIQNLHWHALAGNAEMRQAALSLRTPEPVNRYFYGAERVTLDSGQRHLNCPRVPYPITG